MLMYDSRVFLLALDYRIAKTSGGHAQFSFYGARSWTMPNQK